MSAHLQTTVVITTDRLRREALFGGARVRDSVQSLSVRTSAAFSVAPARLFYALTIPEYVETWLTAPDAVEVRCAGNPAAGEVLSIELHHNRHVVTTIFADYKSLSPQDIHMRWYVRSSTHTHVTQVRIAIRTVRADVILRLRHAGFTNPSAWHWHQELWGMSLTKMQMLIR